MISSLLRRVRREACRQLVVELYRYNKRDDCWDPVGSVDRAGLNGTIESIAQGKLKESSVEEAKYLFRRRRKK